MEEFECPTGSAVAFNVGITRSLSDFWRWLGRRRSPDIEHGSAISKPTSELFSDEPSMEREQIGSVLVEKMPIRSSHDYGVTESFVSSAPLSPPRSRPRPPPQSHPRPQCSSRPATDQPSREIMEEFECPTESAVALNLGNTRSVSNIWLWRWHWRSAISEPTSELVTAPAPKPATDRPSIEVLGKLL
ncbi:hypothetical protein V6N13_040878 [Hibiscus sabdariffa]|uniref:Uncharacterized protein n=1 Tax=Hibiscus sabdariffa TaxID=183260 RepID=A0ABR2R9P7_9ROSI